LTVGKKPQGRIKQADYALCQATHEQQMVIKKAAPEGAAL
jgi:hypothetical protein